MNIKFGMDNFYVRYLKRFLNNELEQSTNSILGKFNTDDLDMLVKYLNLPNVKNMFEVQKEIVKEFPFLETEFILNLQNEVINWTSREISDTVAQHLIDNIDKIKNYCESVGWELLDINDWFDITKDINGDGSIDDEDREIITNIIYNGAIYDDLVMKRADINLDGIVDETDLALFDSYRIEGRLTLSIKHSKRKNYFPNKDMLAFVNQFKGTFLYDYAINDGRGDTPDDTPHPTDPKLHLKVALYECYPGQKVTIAHNNAKSVHLVIGSSPATLKQNIPSFPLGHQIELDLASGEAYQYTCSKASDGTGYDAHWLCIQCPSSYSSIGGDKEVTVSIQSGDVNQDGKINMQDYHLLAKYTAYGPGSQELKWEPTPRQLCAMDINCDGVVDNKDTLLLKDYLDEYLPMLPLVPYTYYEQVEDSDVKNVSNLLIIDGHYYNYDETTDTYAEGICKEGTINIPFKDFISNDWVIHEKFFNYLLAMAVHPYSTSTNITYMQNLLKEVYPEHMYDDKFFYPGYYSDNMKTIVKDFQKAHTYYTIGDLDNDGKLTMNDANLLKSYLDDPQHQLWVLDPLNNEDSNILGEFQKGRADINNDGKIDYTDYDLLVKEINGETHNLVKYQTTFNLGWIDVEIEKLLEEEYNSYGNISEVSK